MSMRSSRAMGRVSRNAAGDLLRLVATRWGWVIIGIAALVGGLIWGLASQQISYMHSDSQTKYDIGSGTISDNTYINIYGTDTYYAAFTVDFIVPSNIVNQAGSFTFIARTDTSPLDTPLKASDGSTITSVHKIEKLVFYDQNGKVIASYTAPEYQAHPNGYAINNWPYAGPLTGAGALCVIVMLYLIFNDRKRLRLARAAELAALEARPSIFARELGQSTAPASPQPYQGINQYPQSLPGSEAPNPYQPRS